MLISDIRHHITTDFVVYREFGLLCGSNIQAATLLSGLFWWSDVIDKEPKRHGWIYKTAAQLFNEFGLTRRGYEKARKFLLGKGVIQCRRAGVHGRLHWQLNKERLLELCYLVKGEPLPQFDSRYHLDIDNFRLEKWVNLDLWNDFLKMRAEKGKPVNLKQKKNPAQPAQRPQKQKLRPRSGHAESYSERLGRLLRLRTFPHPNTSDVRGSYAQSAS